MVESPVQRAAMTVHGRFSSGLLGRGEGSSERFCHFNPARRESSPPVEGVVCPSSIGASLQWSPSKEGIEMMINHTLCFANLLSGDSSCVLFVLVQLRQLVLPVGATSSMWLHVFCESDSLPQWNWWFSLACAAGNIPLADERNHRPMERFTFRTIAPSRQRRQRYMRRRQFW